MAETNLKHLIVKETDGVAVVDFVELGTDVRHRRRERDR